MYIWSGSKKDEDFDYGSIVTKWFSEVYEVPFVNEVDPFKYQSGAGHYT